MNSGHISEMTQIHACFLCLCLFLCRVFSPESVSVLRGVVVPGRGGAGRAHLHPAAGFHPHHQRTEQEVRQEVGIR